MRMQVVVDESGRVVAAAHVSAERKSSNSVQTGFYPLAGQKIVEVDVPHPLRAMTVHERLYAVLAHRLHADGDRLEPVTQK